MRPIVLLALSGCITLSGCTLVVGGVTPPACSTNSQCAILNEVNGIASDACELYQCSASAICELGVRDGDRDGLIAPQCATAAPQLPVDCNDAVPGGTEICNGLDDDCDGVIDEHFVAEGVATNPLPAEAPAALVSGSFSDAGDVAYGAGGSGLAMAYAEGGVASFGLVSGATTTGPVDMSFARATDLADLNDRTLTPGCHVWDGVSAAGGETCRFNELELGLTADSVFTSAISHGGCSHGQVRVGYFPRSSASTPAVIERGPLRRTPVFGGVDVGIVPVANNRCTGASRASGVWGATRPALAAMDLSGARDQALTAWIADSSEMRGACGGAEADVEVLGVHVQEATSGMTFGWVTASGEGVPQVLGRTTGGGRPGIGVWDNTGYVVAFGAAGGGIQLAFVEMMQTPPAFTTGTVDDRTGLETAPLTVTDLGVIAAGAADDVVVATGSIRAGGIDLGLAWREGCGAENETIRFRQIFLARDGSSVSIDEARSFEAIDLTPSATNEAGPPAIVYMFDRMLAPGVDREGDRPTGTPETDGGWIVAWSDDSEPDPGTNDDTRILARRVSEADGLLLSDEELLVLNAPGDVRRSRPVLYRGEDDRVFHAFITTGPDSAFRGGALTCVPGE